MKNFKNSLLVVFLSLPLFCLAQLENRFSIGPRAGVNFAKADIDASSFSPGLVAGITSTYSINEGSGVTVDLLYSSEEYNANANYLRIPILYNVFFGDLGEALRPKIYVGAAPGIFLNAKVNGVKVVDAAYNTAVIDLMGGFGLNYRLANRVWLNADLRAALGLTPISDVPELKGQNIQLTLGVAYGL